MAKRRLRKILIILGLPLAIVLLLILLADTALVKRPLLAAADRKLRSALGVSLTAGRSTLRLTRLAATLRDVRLAPVAAGTGPLRAFTAEEITVDLAWSTLFGGDLHAQEIRIVRPRLEAVPEGENPLPSEASAEAPGAGPGPEGPAKPFSFVIERFALLDGAVTIGGSGRSLAFDLEAIRLDLGLLGDGPDHRAALRASGGRMALSGPPLEIRSLEADLVLDAERIDIKRILLATPRSRLEVKGQVREYQSSPAFDVTLTAGLDLEEAAALLPTLPAVRGALAVEGTFKGTQSAGAATLDLRSERLSVEGFPEAAFRLSAESDLQRLDVKEIIVESMDARLEARGRISLPGAGDSRLDLSWTGFDLALLSSFLPDIPLLDAVSQGKVTAGWSEYRLDALRASGKATFRSARRAAYGQAAPAASSLPHLPFEADFEFGASRDGLDIRRSDLRAAGAALSFSGQMAWDGTLKGRFEFSLPDLAASVRAAMDLTGPLEGLPAIAGRARIDGTVEGTAAAPILRADLAASDLAWNALTVDSLEASFTVDIGDGPAVEITRFRAALPSGALEGRFAFRPGAPEGPGPRGPVFEAAASSAGLDLAFLAPLLPEATPSGRLAFRIEGRGPFERPVFSVRVDGHDLAASGARIPYLSLAADSDGLQSRARLTAGPSADDPAPLVVEADLPFSPPYLLTARLRADSLVLDHFLAGRQDPAADLSPPDVPQTPPAASAAARIPIPLTAEGTLVVPLQDMAGSSIALDFEGLDLEGLAALAGISLPAGAGGRADLSVRASGDPTRPASLSVEGEIGRLAFSGGLPPFEARVPVRFGLRDGVFRLEELTLEAGDSRLRLSGAARGLGAEPRIEARASLDLDASLIPADLVDASVGGRLTLDVSAEGPAGRLEVRGQGALSSGFLQARDFPLTLSDLSLQLELRDRTVLVTDGKGQANGGLLAFSGRVDLGQGAGLGRAAFDAGVEGFRLNFPPGLITLSDGKVRLEGDGRGWLLAGDLRILQGSFREDVFPGAELLGFSNLPLLPEGQAPSAAADAFRLDIRAATVEPIVVRNNMADFALEANIRVAGTLAAPLLSGRVRNVSVGEIVFGERPYTLETLRLEFLGQPVPDPQVEVTAHTRMLHRMEDLEIRLRLYGPASDLKFDLTSTPPRSSQDLSLLLLTGRSLDEVRGSALDTLRGQMILHFTSPLLSPVTRNLERFLGLDDIHFMPMSIASEEDPGARLTFVKNLSDQLALTYSLDISQTERQSWFLDYSLNRKFAVRGYKKDDGSYGGSFRHTIPLGADREAAAREREILAAVEIEGGGSGEGDAGGLGLGLGLDRRLIMKACRPLRAGRPFRVSDLGRATDNLYRLYRRRGFADVDVTPIVRRTGEEGAEGVTVAFRIEPGEPAVFDFRGDRIARKLRKRVLAGWTGKLPVRANLAAARETISAALKRKRYFRAEVAAEELPGTDGGPKTYAISVARNGRYAVRGFQIEGNAAVDDRDIRKAASEFPLAESRDLWNLVHTRRLALRAVKRVYEERGYTKASIDVLRFEEDHEARRIDIVLGVEEGPRRVVRSVAFEGTGTVKERDLRAALALREGEPFDPVKAAGDRTALLNLYRGRGFQSAVVEAAAGAAGRDGTGDVGVAIVYRIDQGPRHTISTIEVSGEGRTGERFIRGAAGLKPGRPVTSEGLARAQKRLYDTRIFRSVNIGSERENEGPEAAEGTGGSGEDGSTEGVNERVTVEVREMPPVTLAYGLRYNSEKNFEGFGEIDLRSPFGDGLAGLLAGRLNKRERDARFSVESNYLFGVRFNLLTTVYAKREIRDLFTADEAGLTIQSRFRLPMKSDLSVLLRGNRIHTFDPADPGSAIEDKVFVSEVAGLLLRDTRDDLLDPRRGSFLSLAVTWSPEFLPTEMPYLSVFGQYQNYHRFGPGLVWAAAGRVGLADAFGRELVAAKRFFAGGGTSVRGFAQDGVGPVDPLLGVPAGGAVVVVMNQELRFPIFGPASGVVFYDAGAVYPTLRDVRIGDIRHGMGLGLRLRSPVGLVRADYGFNPWRRAGEKRAVFYLSIGQAF